MKAGPWTGSLRTQRAMKLLLSLSMSYLDLTRMSKWSDYLTAGNQQDYSRSRIAVSELGLSLESAGLNWDYFSWDSDAEFLKSKIKSKRLDKIIHLSTSCPQRWSTDKKKKNTVCCLGSAAEGSLSLVWGITQAPGEITSSIYFNVSFMWVCKNYYPNVVFINYQGLIAGLEMI